MSFLDITNYREHPTEVNWLVFRFGERAWRDEYAEELRKAGIPHEVDPENKAPYMVAVRRGQRKKAVELNYLVLGRHRSPFLGSGALRWVLIGLVVLTLLLAVIGALRGGA
ncbi:MAG: hypothetical protein JNM31_15415 [Flavobacteriales bacterium]|nr:hypothetical protein [Flavobacteriales bacterium]